MRCQMQFRQILKKIVQTKEAMGDTMKASAFALTESKYAAGDAFEHVVFENVDHGPDQSPRSDGERRRGEAPEV